MKTFGSLAASALLLAVTLGPRLVAADPAPDAAGYWEGAIVLPTASLAIQVELARTDDRTWRGAIDIPAQGTHGFALKPVTVEGDAVTFGMPGVPGSPLFSGHLAGDAITGDFSQGGQIFSFHLNRAVRPAPPPPGIVAASKDLEGRWQGSLQPAPGVELRLALEVTRTGAGVTKATLISIDQGNGHIPVTAMAENGGDVHFECAAVGGEFNGKLNGEKAELAGEWKQGGRATPLVLHRVVAPPAAAGSASGGTTSAGDFNWLLLSPIPLRPAGDLAAPDEAAQKKWFGDDLLVSQRGEARIHPHAGDKCPVLGTELAWRAAEPAGGIFTLNSPEEKEDFELAYAFTEFDAPAETQAWLGIGSDDGVRVWLNGVLVHEHWVGRAVQADDDVVRITLKPGKNQLLLKVQNMTGGWGFACHLMNEKDIASRLIAAAKAGDLTALKDLTGRGFDVNAHARTGLTPYAAARIWGQKEAAEFLATKGADTHVSLPTPEKLVDALLAGRIAKDGAGAAVLVARNGAILYEKAFGLADIEHHVPVTVDTKFRIGSITKQFTASGILRLQEDGKLRITDTLEKFYPDFPRGGEVTLQRLLTHTSGVHSYTDSIGFIQTVTTPTTNADLIATIKNFPFDFKPGLRWSYSNSGYFLLGDIVQKASGRDYGDFLGETFFTPLKMTSTGVYHNSQPPAGAAVGYGYENGHFNKALDWDMSRAGGAGAIYSTVGDLYLWNEAVFGGKVLNPADLEAALTPVVTEENRNDKSDSGYGFGWGISRFRGAREISHSGGLQGFLSNLLRIPDKNFTVVVLINSSPPKPRTDPGTLSHEIAEIYLGAELAPVAKPEVSQVVTVPEAALAAIVGRYDYRMAIMVVTREGSHVYGQLGPQPKFEIFPKSETEFFWKVVDAQVTFEKDAAGKVIAAIHHQGGQTIHAPRLEEVKEVALADAQADALLGDYDLKAAGRMTISREGGKLYGQLTGQPKLELGATSETELFARMINAQLTFVKGADGKVTKAILHQGGQDAELPKMAQP